jgi:hypothetical protein
LEEGGWGRSQIKRQRESLVLYTSFHTLWLYRFQIMAQRLPIPLRSHRLSKSSRSRRKTKNNVSEESNKHILDFYVYRKKRFTSFLSPAGMSLTKLPLGRNNSVMTSLFPPRESLVVTSRLGTGNSPPFFTVYEPSVMFLMATDVRNNFFCLPTKNPAAVAAGQRRLPHLSKPLGVCTDCTVYSSLYLPTSNIIHVFELNSCRK